MTNLKTINKKLSNSQNPEILDKIELGVWTKQKPDATNFITSTQIKNKKGSRKSFSWLFCMPVANKTPPSTSSMQNWKDVFLGHFIK